MALSDEQRAALESDAGQIIGRYPQSRSALLPLREEILAVISRHVSFEPDKVQIKMDRGKSVSTLEVDIEIPNGFGTPIAFSLSAHA